MHFASVSTGAHQRNVGKMSSQADGPGPKPDQSPKRLHRTTMPWKSLLTPSPLQNKALLYVSSQTQCFSCRQDPGSLSFHPGKRGELTEEDAEGPGGPWNLPKIIQLIKDRIQSQMKGLNRDQIQLYSIAAVSPIALTDPIHHCLTSFGLRSSLTPVSSQ